ncbi:MAG TPA: prolyl oligopeptidase family serine peptidase [Terracidiphilus sp.]|nr:prolyl oligopeptidase family serine peptidase [Terracidiphilus sp.]
METFLSGKEPVRVERYEPAGAGPHPALLMAHGSGGPVSYCLNRLGPQLAAFGVGVHAPHYFDKTHTSRAAAEVILDGQHFPEWLRALEDAVSDLRARPGVDARRIGVLGVSLGAYLSVALGIGDPNMRLVIELSGGIPPGWEERVSPATPPVLLLHGVQDAVVPVSEAYKLQRLLTERGARCQAEIFPHENHWISAHALPKLVMSAVNSSGNTYKFVFSCARSRPNASPENFHYLWMDNSCFGRPGVTNC